MEIKFGFLDAFFMICSHEAIMPFIPIGLKETIDINFMETFSDRVSHFFCYFARTTTCAAYRFRTDFFRMIFFFLKFKRNFTFK